MVPSVGDDPPLRAGTAPGIARGSPLARASSGLVPDAGGASRTGAPGSGAGRLAGAAGAGARQPPVGVEAVSVGGGRRGGASALSGRALAILVRAQSPERGTTTSGRGAVAGRRLRANDGAGAVTQRSRHASLEPGG